MKTSLLSVCVFVCCLLFPGGCVEEELCDSPNSIIREYSRCTQVPWLTLMSEYGFKSSLNKTEIWDILRGFCSFVRPEVLTCFTSAVKSCSEAANLTELAEWTGGLCSGDLVIYWVRDLIVKLTEPLSYTDGCYVALMEADPQCQKLGEKDASAVAMSDLSNLSWYYNWSWGIYDNCLHEALGSKPGCDPTHISILILLEKALPGTFGTGYLPTTAYIRSAFVEPFRKRRQAHVTTANHA